MSVARALAVAATSACVVFRCCGDALAAQSATPTVVPMTVLNNHVYVDALVDTKGPYHFVLDSGSPFGLLDSALAADLGLSVRRRGAIGGVGDDAPPAGDATVSSLSLGGRELSDRRFVVTPLRDTVGTAEGLPIDGVIGRDLLASVVTTVDYDRGTVTLDADFGAAVRAGASVVPMRLHDGLPQLACRIAGVAGRCTVDTGSRLAVTVLAPFARAHPATQPAHPTAVGADGYGLGGPAFGRLALLPSLAFGDFVLRDTVCDFSTQRRGAFADPQTAANLGGGVWRRFAVTFDYARGRIALRPGAAFATPERFDRSGLFLVSNPGGSIRVLDVRPGTPAADAGLRTDDVIRARDGHDVAAADLPALREILADPTLSSVTLSIERDGAPRETVLALRDFVR